MPFRDRLERNAALLAPYQQQSPPNAVVMPYQGPSAMPLTSELMPYQGPPAMPDYGQQPPAAIVVAGQTYYAAHTAPQPMAYPMLHPAPYQHPQYEPAPKPPRGPDHWTRKPHLVIPAVIIGVSTAAVAAIVLFYALFAVVTVGIANAFAIGVSLLGIVGVGLLGMFMATRMRHGYPSTNHTSTMRHK